MAKKTTTAKTASKLKEIEVTEEYLTSHPELAEKGIVIGDIIESDEESDESHTDTGKSNKSKEKSKGAIAVLKGEEYIRTYSEDQAEELAEFLDKNPTFTTALDASIDELEVAYEVKDSKTGNTNHLSKRFTDKAEALIFRNQHRSVCKLVTKK